MLGRTVFDHRGVALQLGARIGAGGEGAVHELVGTPDFCAKVFLNSPSANARRDKIEAMLRNPPTDPTLNGLQHRSIAWPAAAIFWDQAGAQFCGFLMPRLSGLQFKELHHCFSSADRNSTFGTGITFRHLLTVAANLSSSLAAVHARNHRVGDLREANLLVNREALVSMIDCDSFQIADALGNVFFTTVATPGYIPPEMLVSGINLGSFDRTYSDYFALGILIFRLLMDGNQPYAAVGRQVSQAPDIDSKIRLGYFAYDGAIGGLKPPPLAPAFGSLPMAIRSLLVRCFREGHRDPTRRPTPGLWQQTLLNELPRLIACSRNPNHVFSSELRSCPWCKYMQQQGTDLFPPSVGGQIAIKEPGASAPLEERLSHLRQVVLPMMLGGSLTAAQRSYVTDLGLRLQLSRKQVEGLLNHVHQSTGVPDGNTRPSSSSARAAAPRLEVQPTSIDATQLPPGQTYQVRLTLSNVGGGTLSGNLTTSEKWISLSSTVIDESRHQQDVVVTISSRGMREGFGRTASVYFATNSGTVRVPVRLQVQVPTRQFKGFRKEVGFLGVVFGGIGGVLLFCWGATTHHVETLGAIMAFVVMPVAIFLNFLRRARSIYGGREKSGAVVLTGLGLGATYLMSRAILASQQWLAVSLLLTPLAGYCLATYAVDFRWIRYTARWKVRAMIALVVAGTAVFIMLLNRVGAFNSVGNQPGPSNSPQFRVNHAEPYWNVPQQNSRE